MPKPRIVQIVTSPQTAKAFLRGQLRFLREQGFDVTLITGVGPELAEVGTQEGVATVAVPMRREPSPLQDAKSLVHLTSVLRRLQPDIVHCGTPKASFLGGFAAWFARVPVRLMTLHGMRADGLTPPARNVVLAMERMSCRSASRVYCVGESLRQRALELKLAPPQKLRLLAQGTANGIDAQYFSRTPEVLHQAELLRQRFSLASDTPVMGFVGRLVQDKGVAELVAAFQQLRREISGLKLLIVGPFEDYDGLTDRLRAEIAGNPDIIQLGFLDDPRPAYALMTVLALPSYREGFPYVPMEAAAMGLPVVATQVTGCIDAVQDGITGLLVPARDAAAMANALRRYFGSPELCREHGTSGRERVVRDFCPSAIWEALAAEYTELLRLARRSKPVGVASTSGAMMNFQSALRESRSEP